MSTYIKAALVGGIVIPILLHLLPGKMSWWPDTVSLGVVFAVVAVACVWKTRKDREMNRRLWNAVKPDA